MDNKTRFTRASSYNNRERFLLAHKRARMIANIVGDYQIAFTIALRESYQRNPVNLVPVKRTVKRPNQLLPIIGTVITNSIIIAIVALIAFVLGGIITAMSGSVLAGITLFIMFVAMVAVMAVTDTTDTIDYYQV